LKINKSKTKKTKKTKKSTPPQSGLGLVLSRNNFYRDHYKMASLVFFLFIAINALLVFGIVYKVAHPPETQYFAITPDGRIVNSRALSDPSVSDSYVLQWTTDAVRHSFAQDYIHYRSQLQSVADDYTAAGWTDFKNALLQSNNLRTLVDKKMVSNVTVTKPPVITQKQVVSGHYAWKINMSIMVTYQNATNSINMPFEITVIVLREPVSKYPDQIAINNFLPVLTKTSSGS